MPIGDADDPNTPIYNEILHGTNEPDGYDYPAREAEARGYAAGQGLVRFSQMMQVWSRGFNRAMAEAEQGGGDGDPDTA